jgi:galactokinase
MQSFRFASEFGSPPAAEARAPGRVNLIGEHTDYSGGLALPVAVSLETRVAVRFRSDRTVRGVSRERGAAGAELEAPAAGDWLDYVRGVACELVRARRIPAAGFDVAVAGDVPEDAGLSSSAALAVASAHALAGAAGAPFREAERAEVAEAAHRAETGFVGVPCGIMDQYAIACAEPGCALLLDCARVELRPVPLPEELTLLVVDTGVRRELRGGDYQARVDECQRAREQASAALGRPLANLSELRPEEVLELDGALDPVALRRARHVTSENQRVERFVRALEARDLRAAGRILYESHESLAVDYEVSWREADLLVRASRDLDGVLGARLTGAGWGGCTLHLVQRGQQRACAAALCAVLERSQSGPVRCFQLNAVGGAGLLPPFP